MKMNRVYKWFCLSLAGQIFLLSAAIGQNNYTANLPQIIPMSPQAAQFIRYGEIPVGHTTGVPQVNVPIYTLSTGWIDIPISISYHASGFRPGEIPSPVGLGWVLNAGGMISRSVEMSPDYKTGNSSYNWDAQNQIKSASDVESLKNGTKTFGTLDFHPYGNWSYWEPFFFPSVDYPVFDSRSDRYSYSYLGNSGVARYNVDTKTLTPIPYDPIKIEKTGSGFLITDTKGIKYEFTQTENTFVNGKGTHVTGWYLTKITGPGKESEPVVFSYQNGTSYSDYYSSYSQFTSIIDTRSVPGSTSETVGKPQGGAQTFTGRGNTTYSSPLIATITWKNVTITFSYASDRQDQRKDRITSVKVKYGGNTVKQAIFDNSVYFGNSSQNYRLKLSGILLKGSNTTNEGDQYAFNYHNEDLPIPNYDIKCNTDYWGYYNGTSSDWSFPNDINIDQATGNVFVGAWFDHTVPSTNRRPDENSTKACVLKEIIYPTKGKSVFEYQLNQVPNPYQFMSNYDYVGGLRLKQRTNYSDANTIAEIKSYIYEGYPTQVLTNDLFVYRMEYIDSYYELLNGVGTYALKKIEYPGYHFVGMPMTSLSGWTGSNVFYNKVKEYNGTSPNTSEGWVEYNYEQENRYLNDACSFNVDDYPPYMFSKYVDCDKGNIKELLKNVIYYDKNGDPVKKVENQHQLFSIPSVHTGVRVFQNAIYPSGATVYPPGGVKTFQNRLDFYNSGNVAALRQTEYQNFYLDRIYAMDTYAFCDVSLPSETTETDYVNGVAAISKTTSYSYDTKDGKPILFTPSSVTNQNSKGETFTQKISFPYSDAYKNSVPYNTMVSKNILSPVIEQSEYKNNQFLRKTVTEYKEWQNGLFAPEFIKLQGNSQSALEPRITYYNYDPSGNPLYLSKDNADKVVYLWGYNGQYPVAKIVGKDYATVMATPGLNQSVIQSTTTTDADMRTELNKIRTANSSALVTTYTYKPLVGMTSETDPNGRTTSYIYDSYGRLAVVKDKDGKVLKKYCYNYAGQQESCNIYTNAPITGYYYSQNCPPGQTPVAYYVSVPGDMFVSSVSQPDADAQAQDYAQQLANAEGTCMYQTEIVLNAPNACYVITLYNQTTSESFYFYGTTGVVGYVSDGVYDITVFDYNNCDGGATRTVTAGCNNQSGTTSISNNYSMAYIYGVNINSSCNTITIQ